MSRATAAHPRARDTPAQPDAAQPGAQPHAAQPGARDTPAQPDAAQPAARDTPARPAAQPPARDAVAAPPGAPHPGAPGPGAPGPGAPGPGAPGPGAEEAQHKTAHIRPQRVEPRPAGAPGAPGAAAAPGADLFARPFGELAVGDRFATAGRRVAERDILGFAALTGDRHPQHTDQDWAARSRFGEQIAHGLLVLSFAVGLLPLDPERIVALRRVGDAVFKQPVKIGDTVHVEGEIVRTRDVDAEQGLVEARLRILNQEGRLAVRTDVELVWRR